jgi:hypothetical protein
VRPILGKLKTRFSVMTEDDDVLLLGRWKRANAVLSRIHFEGAALRNAMGRDIKRYFDDAKRSLSKATLCRIKRRIPESGPNTELMTRYVEERLFPFLQSVDAPAVLVAELLNIAKGRRKDISTDTKDRSSPPTSDRVPSGRAMTDAAIKHLFGMSRRHYSVGAAIAGEYLGYRRSANHGDIIRFYIKIWRDREDGLLRFTNRYSRGRARWLIEGFGFEVDGTTYLIGHATSETGKNTSLGLRCFALMKYREFDWFVGPLLSMDDKNDPIAARLVLIPADQHRTVKAATDANRNQTILDMIKKSVSLADIDQEMELLDVDEMNPFVEIPCSVHVQSLIWNGTFTTLHARSSPLIKPALLAYRHLEAFQRRAIKLSRMSEMDFAPFVYILRKADEILPENMQIDDYLYFARFEDE